MTVLPVYLTATSLLNQRMLEIEIGGRLMALQALQDPRDLEYATTGFYLLPYLLGAPDERLPLGSMIEPRHPSSAPWKHDRCRASLLVYLVIAYVMRGARLAIPGDL